MKGLETKGNNSSLCVFIVTLCVGIHMSTYFWYKQQKYIKNER